MSKIGEKAIKIPTPVQVDISGNTITITGKCGELTIQVPRELSIKKTEDTLRLLREQDTKKTRSLHGLYRSIVFNAIQGVEEPWKKELEVVGTGYNVKLQGEDLVFKVGYSHLVTFKKIPGNTYQVDGNTKVTVSGPDKQLVGQTAHQIKLIKKPDVYKGKGIRFVGEKLRLKPGKKAKTA